MKLKYLFAAALATASLAAQGETTVIGKWLDDTADLEIPFDTDETQSGSQTIYTAAMLADINSASDFDYIEISSIRIPYSFSNMWFGSDPYADFTVYASMTDKTAYEAENGKYTWLAYKDGVRGTGTLDSTCENFESAIFNGEYDCTYLVIDFPTPVRYDHNSNLVLTWEANCNYNDYYQGVNYGSIVSGDMHSLYTTRSSPDMSGQTTNAYRFVPTIELTYTKKTEVHEPTFEAMDAAESIVGQWTSGTASGNEDLPFKTDYEVSGSQTIYTPGFLTDLNTNPDYAYVEISSITVPILLNEGATYSEPFISWIYMGENMDERAADFTVFASTVDETEFIPDKNGDFAYLPYDDGIKGIGHLDAYCDGIENVGYDIIYVTVNFDTPIKYTPGQNLMLTWECMSNIYGESWMEPTYATNANDGKYHSVYINNMNHSKSGVTRYPTLKLGYTPYKEVGSTVEALVIENAEFSLDQVAVAAGLSGFSDLTLINRVNLEFDVTGAAEGTELTVAIGNDVVGTTTDGHVTIGFIRPTATDITVAVSADGYKSAMQRISCEPVSALFPAAEVELEQAAYYVEPDANYSSRASLNAAVRYHMGTEGYAAIVRSSSNHLIHQSTSLPDELAEFEVGALYNQLHENDHRANCYIKSIQTLDVVDGVAQLKESDPRITADLTVNYPVVVAADNTKSGLLLTAGAKRAVADDMVINSTAYAKADNIVKPSNYGYSGVTHTVPYYDGGLTGIEDVMADAADGECEVFTLTGVRVIGALSPGVYVMRRGGVASKVVVR